MIERVTVKYCLMIALCVCTANALMAQSTTLDNFEIVDGWECITSDGVEMQISTDEGHTGNAVRYNYNFAEGTGYGGIQKIMPIDLSENYEISFWIKANSPANNFEIKLIDASGENVWWVNNRNYDFPTEWKRIKIKKRHLSFAWGPSEGKEPTRFDRIEFTVASFVGGKGTVWIDDLKYEPLPPETNEYPQPVITATSSKKATSVDNLMDNSLQTIWESKNSKSQDIILNLKQRREYGGIHIDWERDYIAEDFDIYASNDGSQWRKIAEVTDNQNATSIIRLVEGESNFLKIHLRESKTLKRFGIKDLALISMKETENLNDFYIYRAENASLGNYPRYFSKQASYWAVSGVNNDTKEALINEDGMVEVEKAGFSIEPMLMLEDTLYNWSNVSKTQYLGNSSQPSEFQYIPSVSWQFDEMEFTTQVASGGEAGTSSNLYVKYSFYNGGNTSKELDFYLLLRPFQVNPYYQFLNLAGGVGEINSIESINNQQINVDEKTIIFQKPFESLSTYTANQGDIVSLIKSKKLNCKTHISDAANLSSGIVKYHLLIPKGESRELMIGVPYYQFTSFTASDFEKEFTDAIAFWDQKINHIRFDLPKSADRIINTYKTQLVDILINRDNVGFQPGSRSYDRSWIRDGALTSSALLKSGITKEVKDFIDWYAGYLYDNGKVPCVVDTRGPDPVPENDSHGQFIYLIREYFNFTNDTLFLKEKNEEVLMAVDYIRYLISRRTTAHYRNGNDSVRAQYGLVPESISHEGYSAKPMHSYWDDFFIMKGLKDAVDIQHILGKSENEKNIAELRDSFCVNLYNSIRLAMKYKGIDYIPGCAELGDFDATSTTVALTPCNEMNHLPNPEIYNTFDKYYEKFIQRKNNTVDWVNYTPYENRVIGSFIMLNEPEKAHELIEFFLNDQRPQGWYQWAEVVWKDERTPQFIGDMPHTWVGSDFINAIRSMFVYENEYDSSLVIASALYQDWIDAPEGMSVEHLPTYYGEISYRIKKEGSSYRFKIQGELKLPENGIKIQNFNGSKMPTRVLVNGKETHLFTDKYIQILQSPCEVIIEY